MKKYQETEYLYSFVFSAKQIHSFYFLFSPDDLLSGTLNAALWIV